MDNLHEIPKNLTRKEILCVLGANSFTHLVMLFLQVELGGIILSGTVQRMKVMHMMSFRVLFQHQTGNHTVVSSGAAGMFQSSSYYLILNMTIIRKLLLLRILFPGNGLFMSIIYFEGLSKKQMSTDKAFKCSLQYLLSSHAV